MYTLELNGAALEVKVEYLEDGIWKEAGEKSPASLTLGTPCGDYIPYVLEAESAAPTRVRLSARVAGGEDIFHVIPCCIFGDNNEKEVQAGEFPLLCKQAGKGADRESGAAKESEDVFRAPFWSFRADRAAMPLSAVCTKGGTLAVTVDPYDSIGGVPSGVFAALADVCGISLGYENAPISFINKRTPGEPVSECVKKGEVCGRIYYVPAKDELPRLAIHKVIRQEYDLRHERPVYEKTFREAVQGCLESFLTISWNPETREYTNCNCLPPKEPDLHPWRNVKEIGWTGGGVLAYPLVLAQEILGDEAEEAIRKARSGYEMFDQIAGAYNEASGLFYDLTSPIDEDTVQDHHNESSGLANVKVQARSDRARHVNGWWSAFGLAKDVHCSYTVGSALHYMLKTIDFLSQRGRSYPSSWLESARKVMDTVIDLQRGDGAFAYTYHVDRREAADWNGFAGCWFVPCAAYMYHLTGEERYLAAADAGLTYYASYVDTLTCNGTPMDTWKSPDEEGNLAFIRGARLLHEYTGEAKYLTALQNGAEYEFLWRYGYKTRPLHRPLINGWNSCGGSITSVSNPHIHPMGMIVDSDLYYLGRVTGDDYYTDRALDGTAWMMQTLELYPKETGYGRYGVLSERWCPSDGLVIQKDSEGGSYSSWYSYNLWAGAAAFEEACERCLSEDAT